MELEDSKIFILFHFMQFFLFVGLVACFKSPYNLRPDVNLLCWAFIHREDFSFHLYTILTKYIQNLFVIRKYLQIYCLALFY